VKYQFRYSDGRGTVSTSTTEYLTVSDTSVQLRLTQRVVDDLLVIEKTVSTGTGPRGRTRNTVTSSPPMVGDPASRVCGGRTWTIPSVTMSTTASPGAASQVRTDPGTGRVIAVRRAVTVPAGTVETVHYEKTFSGPHGRVVLEFWRSVTDGVSVKYTYRAAGVVATQVLTAIR